MKVKILDVFQSDFQNYTDVYFEFTISSDNLHFPSFERLKNKYQDDYDNWNLGKSPDGSFKYVNHCVKGCVTDGCVYELQAIKNGKNYPTKDVESIIYKIIQTLELFSH